MRTSAQGKWKAAFVISFSRKNFKEKAGKLALFSAASAERLDTSWVEIEGGRSRRR